MFSKGTLWAGAISSGITQIKGSQEYTSGKINSKEYVANTTTNVSETIGLMAGLDPRFFFNSWSWFYNWNYSGRNFRRPFGKCGRNTSR